MLFFDTQIFYQCKAGFINTKQTYKD